MTMMGRCSLTQRQLARSRTRARSSPRGVRRSRFSRHAFWRRCARRKRWVRARLARSAASRSSSTANWSSKASALRLRRTEQGWLPDEANQQLIKLVSTPPPAGMNTVLVGQIFNVQRTLGLTPTEGEAIIFKPDGKGGYQLVGQLTAAQWGDLVRDLVVLKLDPEQLANQRPVPHD